MEDPDADVFLQAAQTKKVNEMFSDTLARLKKLDEKINCTALPANLPLHAERVQELFENYLWKTREKVDEFLTQIKAVVCTGDLLRKQLQGKPWWLKNRHLQLLMHDEIECALIPELAALTLHFDCCITAGDHCQAISDTRSKPCRVPPIDPQFSATHSEAILSDTPLEYTEAPVWKHLMQNSNNVFLAGVRRYGQSVIQLLEDTHLVKQDEWQSVADHETIVHLVSLGLAWTSANDSCFACSPLFSSLLTLAQAWVKADEVCTVAIVMFYKKSIEIMQKLLQVLEKARVCCLSY